MDHHQVEDLDPSEARKRIEEALRILKSKKDFKIAIRKPPNLIYKSGRMCMKTFKDSYKMKVSGNRRVKMRTLLDTLLLLNEKKRFLTQRDIFYKNKDVFVTQQSSDELLDDICCRLGATRRCMGITTAPTGMVIGSVVIKENGRFFNLNNCDVLGKYINPNMDDFDVVACTAKFILVIEKEATYASLIAHDFHHKVRCIMITGKGMPDVSTRYFLRRLTEKIKKPLPVFGLFDCDLYGIKMLCAYTYGSDSLAFDSKNLVTPGIHWLGLRPSDLDKYGITHHTKIEKHELKKVRAYLKKTIYLQDTNWHDEISKMKESKKNCDLGSLTCKLLLRKLANKDWLSQNGDA